MDRFQELSAFVAVSEEEGFAAAARRLKISPPPVTRAINSLEQRLDVKLLTRTTRNVRLTDAGERYLEDARRILAELETADEVASGINATPSGLLSVTAPLLFGKYHVVTGVVEYLQRYPNTQVSISLLDRVVNLLEEGFDAGIRIGELPDSSMRATKVGWVRTVVCASPEYLKVHGSPAHPDDLRNHTVVSNPSDSSANNWRFQNQGKSFTVRVAPRLDVNNVDGAISAVLGGFGITRLLSYQIEQHLIDGTIELILEDFERPSVPVQIVHREGRNVSAKLRAFIDLMAERLRANQMLNP